jgi:uroporphyrinogen III methyltransferase/synthase
MSPMSPMKSNGRVFIIGAGPGDPGLITVRGVRLIAQADVIVYDRAVEAALRWARPDAERIEVGAPAEREIAQDAISMLLAEKAREGHAVARLKWGDPFVFDSGAKEALFLYEQGVPFEVVPGVPVAIGATAYAGVPVTYPGAGDAVVLLRGHESEGESLPEVDWRAVAGIEGTIVCYVGGRLAARVLESLVDAGKDPEEAAALVFGGTQPGQRTITDGARVAGDAHDRASSRRRPARRRRGRRAPRSPALVRRPPAVRPAHRRHPLAGTGGRTGGRTGEPRRAGHRRADVPARTAGRS